VEYVLSQNLEAEESSGQEKEFKLTQKNAWLQYE
jgi:hypothetical protein